MPSSYMTNKTPGDMPTITAKDKFAQLVGGGATESDWGSMAFGKNPLDPTGQIYSWAYGQFESMKQYRGKFDEPWESYFNMVKGNQWVATGAPGVAPRANRMPGWRARPNINYILPIMDDIIATIFDNDPRLVISPTDPWQMQAQYVEAMQAVLDSTCYRQKFAAKARQAVWNALTYGNGYLKFWFDPSANEGEGDIQISVVPTQSLFVDKFATCMADATKICEVSYIPLSELKRMYPDKAALMTPDSAYGSFAEQLTEDGTLNSNVTNQLQIFTPSDDNPRYADKTVFSNPPYQKTAGRSEPVCEVREMWVRDYDEEEYDQQYIHAYDQFGRPIHHVRRMKRLKYKYGRIVTTGAGIILQDKKNCYRCFPIYAMVQDWITPGVFWADGEPSVLADPQRQYNKHRGQLMDTAASAATPITLYEKDSGFVPGMLSNSPGQMIGLNPGGINKFHRVPAPEMPGYFMQAMELPKQDMMFQSGVQGGKPTGRSGQAVQEQVSAGTKRMRMKSKQVNDFLVDCGTILITLIQDFTTPSKVIRVMGSGANAAFAMFDRQHVRGQWDLKIEASSEASNTKAAHRQEAMQLRTLGVIDDQNLLETMEWPGRHELMRRKTGVMGPPHQVPQYPGYPGLPFAGYTNRNRGISGRDGYSLAARAEPAQPPPQPQPAGFQPIGGKKGKKKGGGGPAPGKMPGF